MSWEIALAGVLVWPVVIVGALILFRKQVGNAISRLEEFQLRKVGRDGFELGARLAKAVDETVKTNLDDIVPADRVAELEPYVREDELARREEVKRLVQLAVEAGWMLAKSGHAPTTTPVAAVGWNDDGTARVSFWGFGPE
jgi:hypothetical protein